LKVYLSKLLVNSISSSFLCTLSTFSYSDSYCWPEQEMLGSQAIAYIGNVNTAISGSDEIQLSMVKKPTENNKACEVLAFDKFNGASKPLACGELKCIKGDCGDGAEVTSLPVEDYRNPFVKTSLKNGKKVWLKFVGQPRITPIIYIGQLGELEGNGKFFDHPQGKQLDLHGALLVLDLVTVGQEVWVKADIAPVESSEPPIKIGTSSAQAYFLYKDSKGKIINVVSDIWCD